MRRIQRALILLAAIVFFVLAALAASTASAAEPPLHLSSAKSLAPPVVVPLSEEGDSGKLRHSRWTRNGVIDSPGGQLAGTVTVIVFALFIAGLAPKSTLRD